MNTHSFVMPYAPPDYSRPLADWLEEDPQEAIMAASLERDAWASIEQRTDPFLYRQTGAK